MLASRVRTGSSARMAVEKLATTRGRGVRELLNQGALPPSAAKGIRFTARTQRSMFGGRRMHHWHSGSRSNTIGGFGPVALPYRYRRSRGGLGRWPPAILFALAGSARASLGD